MSAPSAMARWPASRALLSAIGRFHALPADYALPERRDALAGVQVAASLWECERSRRHLNRMLCRRLGSQGGGLDMPPAEWRLALLSAPRLCRLAEHVAAVLVAGEVRRALSRDEVRAWRDWLGQEAHDFARNTAGLLPAAVPASAQARERQVSAQVLGFAWLHRTSQSWPAPVRARFLLKLPVWADDRVCTQDGPDAARWVHAVLAVVESNWCSSFVMKTR